MSRKIVGEALDCPDYDEFRRDVLDPLLKQYRPNDIYNADETSFFFRLLASRTYAFEEESVRGSKHITAKDRMSLLLCTNMTGTDKRKPLIIGKSHRPTALKRRSITIKQLGIEYYSNQNGWMTSPIFQCWLKGWNEECIKQKNVKSYFSLIMPHHTLLMTVTQTLKFNSSHQTPHHKYNLLIRE